MDDINIDNFHQAPIFPSDSLTIEAFVNSGGYGKVFEARSSRLQELVAVKVNETRQGDLTQDIKAQLLEEARHTFNARNPNIVHLYGIIFEPSYYALVMEYCPYGSLSNLLLKLDIPWPLRWRIIYQVSKGMTFLHQMSPVILHLDLKAANILLNEDFHAKICDFGLSTTQREMSSRLENSSDLYATITHMSPQQLKNPKRIQTKSDDVYSFSIVLWEIASGKRPYEERTHYEILYGVGNGSLKPDKNLLPNPSNDFDLATLYRLMEDCGNNVEDKRPHFPDCVQTVEPIYLKNKDDAKNAALWVSDRIKVLDESGEGFVPRRIMDQTDLSSAVTTVSRSLPNYVVMDAERGKAENQASMDSQRFSEAMDTDSSWIGQTKEKTEAHKTSSNGAKPAKRPKQSYTSDSAHYKHEASKGHQGMSFVHVKKGSQGKVMKVNVSNCTNVQIGDQNTININTGPTPGYKPPTNVPVKDPHHKITETDIRNISPHIGKDWRVLGEGLGFSPGEIDGFRTDYGVYGAEEINYQIILKWKNKGSARSGQLANLLNKLGRSDIIRRMNEVT